MSKEYESDDELEAEAARILLKYHTRQTHWYWRFWEWLKAIKHCIGHAFSEFRECYRGRNE